jgi:hypothetical protein
VEREVGEGEQGPESVLVLSAGDCCVGDEEEKGEECH